jgi:cytidylate kinase
MPVITISRQYGSGGDEIAGLLCKESGCRLFDKFLLVRAAVDAGLSENEIVDYSEDDHKVKNFLSRLFGTSQPIAQKSVWKETSSGVRVAERVQLTEETALSLVRKAVEYACRLDNIVIVGRAGQAILKNEPEALHVRVVAPLEDRLLRVRSDPRITEQHFANQVEIRRSAQDLIESRDAASADYLRRFYGVDWSDPLLYHLVVNTGKMTLEQAAGLILEMARLMKPAPETA